MKFAVVTAVLALAPWAGAQHLIRRSSPPAPAPSNATAPHAPASATIPLKVPGGAILKVALDKEVRITHVGQRVQARLTEPVYAFDKLVIPVGSQLSGRIATIQKIHTKTRVLSALNADLSPYRATTVEFDSLRMPDGRTLQLHAQPSAGSLGSLAFVSAPDPKGKVGEAKGVVGKQIAQARAQAKQEWDLVMHDVRAPGRLHRLERMGLAELPYHPQYLDRGTAYDVRLTEPLQFGSETVPAQALTAIGTPPPSVAMVHAILATPLSSATAKKGETVNAVITRPVKIDGQLYVPEGSRLVGKVLQVRPARRLAHNGQLRIAFDELLPPSGSAEKIEGALEAFAANRDDRLTLDAEGGATVHPASTRYLTTALTVALATASAAGDHEDRLQGGRPDSGPSAAGGATGFKAVGMIVGALVHSRALGAAMGLYGASMQVWSNFLARGHDVVYPEGMSMVIAVGQHKQPK